TISAASIPTTIAARKPSVRSPVIYATANPAIAESIIDPSNDRLITPAFSQSVSPTAAKTNGLESASTEASNRIKVSTLTAVLFQPAAQALCQYDHQYKHALNHAAQRRVELQV